MQKLKSKALDEELQSFEASCNDGSLAFNWITEGGSKYAYEIEKTYDKVSYEVFSRAPQPEKKDGKNFYMVEESTGKSDDAFYRLRKVVGKGKYEYSEPVKVQCSKGATANTEVDVFPNGYGSFRIVINTQIEDSFRVSLSDVQENELAAEQFEAKPGSNEFVLSSNTISRGNYVLRVTNGSMVKEKRVVLSKRIKLFQIQICSGRCLLQKTSTLLF
ncbi:MAG: T9SS type A sorting domain-containing protein [Bacteroidetes bacterium]|nr:T9SS type A sorting domain-containing protein [Bacteroidota bacterium]